MDNLLNLNIMTPSNIVYSGNVQKLLIDTEVGKVEILPKHTEMVTLILPSLTEFVDENNQKTTLFTSYGTLHVKNNVINIVCDAAERPENIDRKRAEEAKARAEERLEDKNTEIDRRRAERALMRAIKRLEIKEKY